MRIRTCTCLMSLILLAACSTREGVLITRTVEAPSLAHNPMGISDRQQLAIYLPPSYQAGTHRYPVLYLLPNFNACLWRYTGGDFQGFQLRKALDELVRSGTVREMLVVIPNATHWLGGSWYRNSPLTGNWEDYVVREVVDYVDSHFRTIPSAGARGLAGHGMGGTGALEIALKHSDRFGCVYAMSPGLFAANGLQDCGLLNDRLLQNWQAHLEQWKVLDDKTRRRAFRDYVQTHLNSPSRERSFEALCISYAAAMSPDLRLPYPHIALPSPGAQNNVLPDLVAHYENGFGGWREKAAQYLAKGRPLRAITIECGRDDEYPWIRQGADYVSKLMQGMGVANEFVLHEGGHESRLGWRMETAMLPTVSRALRDSP
jgi:S-formylglutathione hydrolase